MSDADLATCIIEATREYLAAQNNWANNFHSQRRAELEVKMTASRRVLEGLLREHEERYRAQPRR